MPPKKKKDDEVVEIEVEEEKPKKMKKEKKEESSSDEAPKKKKGGLRKMTEKEKTVFNKLMEGKTKSEKAKVRMALMRTEKPVDTPAKLKKLM